MKWYKKVLVTVAIVVGIWLVIPFIARFLNLFVTIGWLIAYNPVVTIVLSAIAILCCAFYLVSYLNKRKKDVK